jgi:hypothetical protein
MTQLTLDGEVIRGSTLSRKMDEDQLYQLCQPFDCLKNYVFCKGYATAKELQALFKDLLGVGVVTIDVTLLHDGCALEDEDFLEASDVNALIIKWSTGWGKVEVENTESSSQCSDELVQAPADYSRLFHHYGPMYNADYSYGTLAPSRIPPNMMFATRELRSVEWAEQSALEFEERMRALLIQPTNEIEYCRGSRKAKLFDLPADAKYDPAPWSTAKPVIAATGWGTLASFFNCTARDR